jgi:hypothetical protein
MGSYAPPVQGTPPPTPDADQGTEGTEQEMRDCPVCLGAGQIPASMGKDEIIASLDQNMPSPQNPEAGEQGQAQQGAAPSSPPPFTRPGQQPMTDEQVAETNRLSDRARSRMKTGIGGPVA